MYFTETEPADSLRQLILRENVLSEPFATFKSSLEILKIMGFILVSPPVGDEILAVRALMCL